MKKLKKKRKLKKWIKITLIILGVVIVLLLVFIGYKICTKYIFKDNNNKKVETVVKEELDLDNYNYYINSSASEYEKKLFDELKEVLSQEEVNDEEYAKMLAKVFVSDLFTLSSKNNSSDISSSQYVYDSYRETYKLIVKDTMYSSIQLNLSGEREQVLPTVSNIEISSVDRSSFSLDGKVIDKEAFNIKVSISYEKDLGYPINYKVVIVKNNDLLQVVKAIKVS